jgi:hypothetical protein
MFHTHTKVLHPLTTLDKFIVLYIFFSSAFWKINWMITDFELNYNKPRKLNQYRDEATGWVTRVHFPAGAMIGIFLIVTATRPALGLTQSLPWHLGTKDCFPGG